MVNQYIKRKWQHLLENNSQRNFFQINPASREWAREFRNRKSGDSLYPNNYTSVLHG